MVRTRRGSFPRSLARPQAKASPRKSVVPPVAPELADFRKWDRTRSSFQGGEPCQEETAQGLTDEVRVVAEDLDGVVVEVEWVETVLAQVPAGIVYAPVVERRHLTRQAFPAMM